MKSESATYVTDLPRIDQEHEILRAFVAQAEAICDVGNPNGCGRCTLTTRDRCLARINAVVAALASYMQQHFRYEEQLMDWFISDDHAVVHRKDHQLLFDRLQAVADELTREKALAVSAQVMINVLGTWIEYHFYEYDAVLVALIGNEDDNDGDLEID